MILAMRQVGVAMPRAGRRQPVLEDFSLSVAAGEMAALVGESGSGKTTAALAIPRLLPPGATVTGSLVLQGQDLGALTQRALRRLCGARMGFVFQDPLLALNPALSVGAQIAEPIRLHLGESRRAAWARAVTLLDEVGIPNAAARAADYPHMFSGGMRQRAMIAGALACNPALLIADEPTAGLDGPLAEQILALLSRLRAARGMAVILISHDLGLVARHADHVSVLYAGRCIEQGPAAALLRTPRHHNTRALLRAAPRLDGGVPEAMRGALPEPETWPPGCRFAPRCDAAQPPCELDVPALSSGGHSAACLYPASGDLIVPPAQPRHFADGDALVRVEHLSVAHRGRFGTVRAAVTDVSFTLARGACLALTGASGAGKTTLARALAGMVPSTGAIICTGDTSPARRRVQLVFQNPVASLDPLQNAGDAVAEALRLAGASVTPGAVAARFAEVGLPGALMRRRPATLSGGQAQRVAIARALAAAPALLLLDEPTANLDVSSAAALLALLRDLAARGGLGYVVITHDLAVAASVADQLAVMDEGRIVEMGDTARMIGAPCHPATRALVDAARAAVPVL